MIGAWHNGSTVADAAADLTLRANSYDLSDATGVSLGDMGVNGTEIDFFNAQPCGLTLPDGVGRYQWSIQGSVLHFIALNQDPCGRTHHLAGQSFTRTSS
ncbi:MAG: hypothetical protein M3Z50_01940 [Actinomycetota bacterium]|nr:hypothetical protein [Actinomycetota bacterium]